MGLTKNTLPWETVSIDLVTNCRPIRKASSQAATKALYEDIVLRFGCSKVVISDNGTQFTGHPFRELLDEMGIKHHLTSPYTPQANPVERANKTVKTMIAQFCDQDQRKWDETMSEMNFAFNTAQKASTGFTPAFMNFGRELQAPCPVLPESSPSLDTKAVVTEADPQEVIQHTERMRLLLDTFELVKVSFSPSLLQSEPLL